MSTTVVTSTRFEQGLRWEEFLNKVTLQRDRLEQNYATSVLTEEDKAFFRKVKELADGPRKLLVLADLNCGDVRRELPTAVHMAEAAGLDLRIFLRDENPDIMDEFLSNDGRSRSLPVFVFYTAAIRYITHFTERSATAHAALAIVLEQVREKLKLPASAGFGNLPDAERKKFFQEVRLMIEPQTDQWRQDAVTEIRQGLALSLGLTNDEEPTIDEGNSTS